jgi:hypothetical protein
MQESRLEDQCREDAVAGKNRQIKKLKEQLAQSQTEKNLHENSARESKSKVQESQDQFEQNNRAAILL